jgi:hypothetical protein
MMARKGTICPKEPSLAPKPPKDQQKKIRNVHPKSSLLIFLHLPILYFSIFAEPPGQKNANAASRYQFFTSGLAMTSKSKASVAETGSRSVASEC